MSRRGKGIKDRASRRNVSHGKTAIDPPLKERSIEGYYRGGFDERARGTPQPSGREVCRRSHVMKVVLGKCGVSRRRKGEGARIIGKGRGRDRSTRKTPEGACGLAREDSQ